MLVRHIPVAVLPIFLLFAIPQSLPAQPSEVSYQGELKKDGLPFTGTAQMKFVIVDGDDETIWSNDGTSTAGSEPTGFVSIETENGIFAVRLGAAPMEPISGGLLKGVAEVSLRVWVNTGDGFEQLTDQPISSSAFSLSGEKCLEIGDLQINVVPRWDGSALVPGALFDDGNNVGVGTSAPATKLDVSGTIRSSAGGFQFPDGTTQTTALVGGGVPSGAMVLTSTPNSPLGFTFTGKTLLVSDGQEWRNFASLSQPRVGAASAILDDTMYVIGGINSMCASGVHASGEKYDFASNMWSFISDLPQARAFATAVPLNGQVYIIGGGIELFAETPTNSVLSYDPTADTWSQRAPIASAAFSPAAAAYDNKIYVVQGESLEAYDAATDSWEIMSGPTNGSGDALFEINGKLILCGTGSNIQEYDPVADMWTTKSASLTPRYRSSATVIQGKIYVFGGSFGGGSEEYATIEEYDPAFDKWNQRGLMVRPRIGLSAVTYEGAAYLIGGDDWMCSSGIRFLVQKYSGPSVLYVQTRQ